MAGYGAKEARITRERKPNLNICGSCGDECSGLLYTECIRIVTETEYVEEPCENS
jgi:hypothetical protein